MLITIRFVTYPIEHGLPCEILKDSEAYLRADGYRKAQRIYTIFGEVRDGLMQVIVNAGYGTTMMRQHARPEHGSIGDQ